MPTTRRCPPPQVGSITDPVSGRVIQLYYGSDSHCTPPTGYDQTVGPNLLCQIAFWDGTTTNLYYSNGMLAAVVNPGAPNPEITQFSYTGGLLSDIESPLAEDWQAAVTGRTPALATTHIAYNWVAAATGTAVGNIRPSATSVSQTAPPARSIPLVASVTAPSPDGVSPTRASDTYAYVGTNETTVHIAGLTTQVDRDVTYDPTGRLLNDTTATGQTSTTVWDAQSRDLPVSSADAAGRVTTTIYDWAMRVTDTYGPAPASCFQASGFPVASPPASCGQIPHTHTGIDTDTSGKRISGLQASIWSSSVNQSGAPTSRSTAQPGSVNTAAGGSQQFTGEVALPPGVDTFNATVGDKANDGVRVTVDGASVLDRWTTERQAILGDTPTDYWRLGDTAGSTSAANQISGGPAATAASSVTFGAAGPGPVDTSTAVATNGGYGVALPSALISGATTPTLELWFKTSLPGSLFGYQAVAPVGTPSAGYVPALYIGSDGELNGEFWNGVSPIKTSYTVDDGKWHDVILSTTSSGQTLYLDGNTIGSLAGAVAGLTMTYNQIGAAYQGGWPDASGGSATTWYGCTCSFADAAFYTHPLNSNQAAAHYAAGTATLTGTIPITFAAAPTIAANSVASCAALGAAHDPHRLPQSVGGVELQHQRNDRQHDGGDSAFGL